MADPLITAEELSRGDGRFRVFDVRWSLTEPGYGLQAYRDGHVPGAVFVDLDNDLSSTQGDGRHPLPDPDEFTETLGRLGLGRDDPVVVYDDTAGTVAARMWWMLESIGHPEVRLLDGGIRAWTELGLPLESGVAQPRPAVYPDVRGFDGVVRFDELAGRVVIDVRAPERYRGEVEPVDPKAGHIPGAVNRPLGLSLGEDGRFLDPSTLGRRYTGLPDDVVVSCGSGVNACHTALALRLAGRPMPDLYVGSFSDWSRRDLPIHTGPTP